MSPSLGYLTTMLRDAVHFAYADRHLNWQARAKHSINSQGYQKRLLL